MSATLTTLCSLADFSGIPKSMEKEKPEKVSKVVNKPVVTTHQDHKEATNHGEIALKYSINIELPTTRDKLVYDAIFKSIKENLL